jgi:hypothetical protein
VSESIIIDNNSTPTPSTETTPTPTPCIDCLTCSLGFNTWDPVCADNQCCSNGNCIPSAGFQPDAGDCVCYSLYDMGQPIEGAYATYSECCAENTCP